DRVALDRDGGRVAAARVRQDDLDRAGVDAGRDAADDAAGAGARDDLDRGVADAQGGQLAEVLALDQDELADGDLAVAVGGRQRAARRKRTEVAEIGDALDLRRVGAARDLVEADQVARAGATAAAGDGKDAGEAAGGQERGPVVRSSPHGGAV